MSSNRALDAARVSNPTAPVKPSPAVPVKPSPKEVRNLILVASERRPDCFTGPKALMFAVLEEGIRSYFSSETRVRHEAERWINATNVHYLFSFATVCEVLDLKPSAVASALRRWRDRVNPGDGLRSAVGPFRMSYRRGVLGRSSGSLRSAARG